MPPIENPSKQLHMKRLLFALLTTLITLTTFSEELVLIKNGSPEATKKYLGNDNLSVHFYNDQLIVATTNLSDQSFIILDSDPKFDAGFQYFLIHHKNEDDYLNNLGDLSEILYLESTFAITKVQDDRVPELYPAIHGGLINITGNRSSWSNHMVSKDFNFQIPALNTESTGSRSPQDYISDMMAEVDSTLLEQSVRHLQDYGTRNAYSTQAVQAQNWIYDKFESYGLDVELHDFWMPSGEASDNVVATLTGTKYPDEYVVCGAHYDSYSWSGNAPGADDNATGSAGILEVARIMSQYDFDRSIIFATWGGEEYGLYGSEAWASDAAADGMDILGYFNMDMAGYLHPGNEIQTDIIAPSSAQELVDFYMETCSVYVPDFIVSQGAFTGGDSDHTSFNNNGYMGIYPFEDASHYSPYIHTQGDTIGISVNSFTMHTVFTQAMIANVASMANLLPATSLYASVGDEMVELEWNSLDDVEFYNVYRNDDPVAYLSTQDTAIIDTAVQNATPYSYYVTAVFLTTGNEGPASNKVTVAPMPELVLPYFEDYETGGWYWTTEYPWGLREGIFHSASFSLTESPDGNYASNMNASASLRDLDFTGLLNVELGFYTKYYIEEDYDYMYLEISLDGEEWEVLDSFTGFQYTWQEKVYSLNEYIDNEQVNIRFRFFSDSYQEENGMFIDDFTITYDAVGINESIQANFFRLEQNHPNPFTDETLIGFHLEKQGQAKLELFDAGGRYIKTLIDQFMSEGYHEVKLTRGSLRPGFYYYKLIFGEEIQTRKAIFVEN